MTANAQTRLFVDGAGFEIATLLDVNPLLTESHYLGPVSDGGAQLVIAGYDDAGNVTSAQVWRHPTSRRLPADRWLELSRWCLTPDAGRNAGSRQHGYAVRAIRRRFPQITTLVSYSDPSIGHTGALYKACNWDWSPTWHRLRPPPSGNGKWDDEAQSVKDRWTFPLRRDDDRAELLRIKDDAIVRRMHSNS